MTMLLPSMHEFRYQEAILPRLENALKRAGAAGTYHVARGPLENAADFVIRNRSEQDAFVIEVKKTQEDVNSPVCWDQSRRYALNSQSWATGLQRFFSITNGETLYVFCVRDDYTFIKYCLLSPGVYENGSFGASGEADTVLARLEEAFEEIFRRYLVHRDPPQFEEYWYPVLEAFRSGSMAAAVEMERTRSDARSTESKTMRNVAVPSPDTVSAASLVFFRALAYEVIRTVLQGVPTNRTGDVRLATLSTAIKSGHIDPAILTGLFQDCLSIDFRALFGSMSTDSTTVSLFARLEGIPAFLRTLSSVSQALPVLNSPQFLISSLVDTVFPHEIRHQLGLAIEDDELADALARWCVQDPNDEVIDTAAGTGALLDAAYRRLRRLTSQTVQHSDLTSQLTAVEKDAFVASMCALRLILEEPTSVTNLHCEVSDAFEVAVNPQYDVLMCNPPYRRSTELAQADKDSMIARIAAAYGTSPSRQSPFPLPSGQADLYMYFVEWSLLFVRPGGRAGWILSDKFLSTQSGQFLKSFLLQHCILEGVVRYSGQHFIEFDVTTCFVLVHAIAPGSTPPVHSIKFLRLYAGTDISSVAERMSEQVSNTTSEARIAVVGSDDIAAEENWCKYLKTTPVGYERWLAHSTMHPISDVFENRCQRGPDNGCSSFFFPYSNFPMKKAKDEDDTGFRVRRTTYSTRVERALLQLDQLGFLRAATEHANHQTSYFLDEDSTERVLVVPESVNLAQTPSLSEFVGIAGSSYVDRFGERRSNLDGKPKAIPDRTIVSKFGDRWYTFYADKQPCHLGLALPRASRSVFKVLLPRSPRYFSTNFFVFDPPPEGRTGIPRLEFSECVAAVLMSSLGQLQCEIEGTGREGLAKFESDTAYKVRVCDPQALTRQQRAELIRAFEALPFGLHGDETPGQENPRYTLDTAVLGILGVTGDVSQSVLELEHTLREDVKERQEMGRSNG